MSSKNQLSLFPDREPPLRAWRCQVIEYRRTRYEAGVVVQATTREGAVAAAAIELKGGRLRFVKDDEFSEPPSTSMEVLEEA